MADDDYVRFEITDHDLQDEFNPNRHSRRTTKHQQIYGVFADSDDSDASTGDARGGRRRGGGGGRQHAKPQKDYTAHVPFVSGGVQGRKKASKSDGDSNASDDDKDANNVDATIEDDVADAAAAGVVVSSESSDEDAAPSSAAYRGFGMENMAGFRQSNASIGTGNVADAKWDKHTKGIGAKLLLKMGYKPGGGLGKNLQGIAQPVQAHVRKGRGAIGLYGTEQGQTIGSSSAAATAKAGQKIDEDRREQQEFQQQMHQWRKTAGGRTGSAAASASHRADNGTGRAGPRYVYRTVEDVIERGHRQPNSILSERASAKLSNVTVIDMTGPEKRILSGYHALGQQRQPSSACVGPDSSSSATAAGKQRDNFRMPELEHNLQLIVDQCEQDIITIDKSQRSCADQQQQLKADQLELGVIVDLERKHIGALERVAALVQRLVGETNADTGELKNDNGGALTLAEVERTFGILQREYAAEYRDFGLADLAPGVVGPLISMELLDWRPLEEPTRGADIVARWREILAVGGGDNATTTQQPQPPSSDAKKSPPQPTEALHLSPYAALVWASIIPHLRRTCSDDWDPRQHAPMAGLLDAWSSLLPAQQLDHVLDRMVLPRIVRAVDEWDPLTDTVPVHAWLLPWHQLLDHATGGRLDERVYERIRQKLGAALVAWRPVDRSARAMLEPWLGVFADAAMEVFLVRNIVPKLQQSLVELVVSPMQQDLGECVCRECVHANSGIILNRHISHRLCRTLAAGKRMAAHHTGAAHVVAARTAFLPQMAANAGHLAESVAEPRPSVALVQRLEGAIRQRSARATGHQGAIQPGAGSNATHTGQSGIISAAATAATTTANDAAPPPATPPTTAPTTSAAQRAHRDDGHAASADRAATDSAAAAAGLSRAGVAKVRRTRHHVRTDGRPQSARQAGVSRWQAVLLHRTCGHYAERQQSVELGARVAANDAGSVVHRCDHVKRIEMANE